jgi:hypothetical protein
MLQPATHCACGRTTILGRTICWVCDDSRHRAEWKKKLRASREAAKRAAEAAAKPAAPATAAPPAPAATAASPEPAAEDPLLELAEALLGE